MERLMSLPNLIKGFSRRDQQEWLNLVFDAAGVYDRIDQILKVQ